MISTPGGFPYSLFSKIKYKRINKKNEVSLKGFGSLFCVRLVSVLRVSFHLSVSPRLFCLRKQDVSRTIFFLLLSQLLRSCSVLSPQLCLFAVSRQ
ncbi:hypothetical protein GDO81_018123 [Engystomops pustulosus]|uniref:Transmembrane protein n=1 Tax=Engystomops pustulosus TaxID=76066 RepID=A0AAV7A5M7_ENGPU|nr:hypothetical protein GDO81_018123 [Engystomops pustulosus]